VHSFATGRCKHTPTSAALTPLPPHLCDHTLELGIVALQLVSDPVELRVDVIYDGILLVQLLLHRVRVWLGVWDMGIGQGLEMVLMGE
jgi:hypothetical protein